MVCSVVQTHARFMTAGCPNCEPFLELAGSADAIAECTSKNESRTRGHPGAEVMVARVADLLARAAAQPFDLIFADPPYGLATNELTSALRAASAGGWSGADAIVVVERSSRDPDWSWPQNYFELRARRYGEATLWYARHAPADPEGG